jgi:hypothetical protein
MSTYPENLSKFQYVEVPKKMNKCEGAFQLSLFSYWFTLLCHKLFPTSFSYSSCSYSPTIPSYSLPHLDNIFETARKFSLPVSVGHLWLKARWSKECWPIVYSRFPEQLAGTNASRNFFLALERQPDRFQWFPGTFTAWFRSLAIGDQLIRWPKVSFPWKIFKGDQTIEWSTERVVYESWDQKFVAKLT